MMPGFGSAYGGARPGLAVTVPEPVAGPVRSAAIDGTGTVLTLVMTGVPAGGWADYPIAGDGTMGVTLDTAVAGFDRQGGQAVANAGRARTLRALKPLRRTPITPVSAGDAGARVLDEVDHGDGSRTVRLRPSRCVYAGDAVTVSLAAGWRTGAPAQVLPVVNGSTLPPAPVSGGRWLTPPKQRVTGPFRVDCMGGSVNPEGLSGLAGVRFDVTDGTTTRTVWADGLSTSTALGDDLRCWGAEIDPAGLNAGPITVHKTLFPWVGPSRTSGAGQAGSAGSDTGAADAPLVMAYDPAGTRYPEAWVLCDPVNGTATPAAAMVQPTLAAARAVAPAARPVAVDVAVQALYLANRSAPAASGGAALARMADGGRIVIPAGVTSIRAGAAVAATISSTECWPIVQGDPDEADPSGACVLAGAATTANLRLTRLAVRDLTLRVSGVNLATPGFWWLHDVQVEAVPGQEASTAFLTGSTTGLIYATRTTIGASTTVGLSQTGSAQKFALVRSCSTPRGIAALAIVGSTAKSLNGWGAGGTADAQADWVCVGNDLRATTTRCLTFPEWASGGTGLITRPLVLNNIAERVGADPEPFLSIGENQYQRAVHMVLEGNSFVGERTNLLYNDPVDELASHNVHVDCRVANGYFDWLPTKHDDFNDGGTAASPTYGFRPALIESLWFQDGLGCEGNVIGRRRASAADFNQHGIGRGSVVNAVVGPEQGNEWTRFTADASRIGTGVGGGDYRPVAGSALLGRGTHANLDVDRAGVGRAGSFAAGACEPA